MKTLAFQITRGGRFNNPGHLIYKGAMSLDQLISYVDNSGGNLFYNEDSMSYYDVNGNEVIDNDTLLTGVGVLDFDGSYDTWYVTNIENLTEKEVSAILASTGYVEVDVLDYITESYSQYINE